MLRWLIGIILGEIICKSSNWQHIQILKITILGANWQLFRLERIAKCSYFILSTQNIKFYWFVMKIKKFMLPIWWCNRGLFPLGNKYIWVFILNGLNLGLYTLHNFQSHDSATGIVTCTWYHHARKFSRRTIDSRVQSWGFDMLNLHDWSWTSNAHVLWQKVKCTCMRQSQGRVICSWSEWCLFAWLVVRHRVVRLLSCVGCGSLKANV